MRKLCLWIAAILLVTILPKGVSAAAPQVKTKSAVLMDVETGTLLYEQNAHEQLAPASVTKVMTMLLIMEALDDGRIKPSDMVTASEAAAAKGGSQIYLKVGEQMSVADMLKSIAVSSANDCACAMAEHLYGSESAFVEKMNARAGELGMQDTNFVNCTGLDDDPDAEKHKTSAYDIALMSRELMKNHPDIKKYTTIWMDTVRNGAFGLSNTNKMVRFYNGCTGLKTGFTSKAGYCLSATASREGMELVAVVMGAESSQDRFAACKQLLDYGFANYAIIRPEVPECTVPVRLGIGGSIAAVPAEQGAILIDKSQKSLVQSHIELLNEVAAPVGKGQRLGTLTLKAGEQVLTQIPLIAETGMARLTWGEIFWKILQSVAFKIG